MPLLSYVTMKGAPQHLFANLSFIQRFRAERRLAFGEASYYFSTMWWVACWWRVAAPPTSCRLRKLPQMSKLHSPTALSAAPWLRSSRR